ncbi:putative aminopeptidase YsdC [Clostridium homopropionicum DSM 5847]|uniref:Putative aminopeptidase YsdC n=1 Tax=Clostridium homopropionicum DSM 5847 TaxID=1121318 RepID=A0A0L6Z7S5_9CLOT|nr:M42 family peptidase [Clostridium homopropionicum]KOA19022.1 putative aminopeptidase YsdC [Clostridium homopropionicum DSM 5847]SFH00673.1 endoglucanase [Clostridium homopropionicum]
MLLKKLCDANAPSGYEGEVRDIIKKEIEEYVDDIVVDRMGNIIGHKKGNGKRVVVDVFMDEPGFIITGYNEDGTLKFDLLGSLDTEIIPCKTVYIGKDKINGVIGIKPIHLQGKAEREKIYDVNQLCIDIGANSKEEAKKIIPLGEYAVFTSQFESFGEGLFKGKALSSRLGCSILLELLKEEYNCDFYGVFSVQGELKGRGSYVSAYNINPELVIAVKGSEISKENKREMEISKVPIISMMSQEEVLSPNIIMDMKAVAVKNNIPHEIGKCNTENGVLGSYSMSAEGTEIAEIIIPCKYANTSIGVCSLEDYKNAFNLINEFLKSL